MAADNPPLVIPPFPAIAPIAPTVPLARFVMAPEGPSASLLELMDLEEFRRKLTDLESRALSHAETEALKHEHRYKMDIVRQVEVSISFVFSAKFLIFSTIVAQERETGCIRVVLVISVLHE